MNDLKQEIKKTPFPGVTVLAQVVRAENSGELGVYPSYSVAKNGNETEIKVLTYISNIKGEKLSDTASRLVLHFRDSEFFLDLVDSVFPEIDSSDKRLVILWEAIMSATEESLLGHSV